MKVFRFFFDYKYHFSLFTFHFSSSTFHAPFWGPSPLPSRQVIRYLENLEREPPYALAKVLVNISGPVHLSAILPFCLLFSSLILPLLPLLPFSVPGSRLPPHSFGASPPRKPPHRPKTSPLHPRTPPPPHTPILDACLMVLSVALQARFASREEYLCASGHREGESSEDYLERASKYIALLAALSQVGW